MLINVGKKLAQSMRIRVLLTLKTDTLELLEITQKMLLDMQ